MSAIIRESPAGQIIRWMTGARFFPYPEELPGFELPAEWNAALNATEKHHHHPDTLQSSRTQSHIGSLNPTPPNDLEKQETINGQIPDGSESSDSNIALNLTRTKSRLETVPWSQDRLEVEEELAAEKTISRPIIPLKTADGTVLVDWYVSVP